MIPISPASFDNLELNDSIMIHLPYTMTSKGQVKHFNRPALVLLLKNNRAIVFHCTSKFSTKTPAIQARYYKINDWLAAGLKKQSYIDVGRAYSINISAILRQHPIGKLTLNDQLGLQEFLATWRNQQK
ncbi:hypothetical protein [Levilactobacillus zymae]|uniref:hypothetical protein n=1 Tax=Levilactobacillus zymae TaxID=267363 RepID=UPI0028B39EAC|nr:hypothetical protein [Levilactobacillus zymae]MDT6980712.1 hypothetical protein [Levilactobacillus zymae]